VVEGVVKGSMDLEGDWVMEADQVLAF